MIPDNSLSTQVHSDASSTFGCRALTSDNKWLQVRWPASWQELDILVKGMVPIVMSAAMWGRSWYWRRVSFYSDNMAVISVIQRNSVKQSPSAPVALSLFYAAHIQFSYSAHHLPGVTNVATDSLSRDNMVLFNSRVPQTTRMAVSQEAMDLLIIQQPNGGSQGWISLFRATF